MPTKNLTSPFARDGETQKLFKFGGGANTITTRNGILDESNLSFVFYTTAYHIDAGGGDDTIFGSDIELIKVEDPDDSTMTILVDGGDTLIGGDGSDVIFGGAGNDTIHGGDELDGSDKAKGRGAVPTNTLVGDGVRQTDGTLVDSIIIASTASKSASSDTIFGGHGAVNNVYADFNTVKLLAGTAGDPGEPDDGIEPTPQVLTEYVGGDDTVTGGNSGADNVIYGDANTLILEADTSFTGGRDILTGGGNSQNTLYGDIAFLGGPGGFAVGANSSFFGGDDELTGGAGTSRNILYGDAQGVLTSASATLAKGGNDVLTAGAGATNLLFGDTVSVSGDGVFQGGSDRLIAGAGGFDTLVGDWSTDASGNAIGGADIFEIHLGTGSDTISDFETMNFDAAENSIGDVVELHGFAVPDFGSLIFRDDTVNNLTTLLLGGDDQIVFLDRQSADFSVDDFVFFT